MPLFMASTIPFLKAPFTMKVRRRSGDVSRLVALERAHTEMEIWSEVPTVGVVEVRVGPGQARLLEAHGFEYAVKVEDLQQWWAIFVV